MAKKSNKQDTTTSKQPVGKPAGTKQQVAARLAENDPGNTSFIYRYAQLFIVTGIALLTWLCYKTCLENQLTNWDDLGYIINNQLIKDPSPEAIKNIFSTAHPVMGNYHPLTILLYYFEYQRYGLEPWIYHFDSIILHILTTIAVYFFIKVLTKRTVAAAVVALLFGLHPMHVESVAWAAGRKDILYGLFFILSIIAYLFYIRNTGTKRIVWYVTVLVLFAISLLAKSVAVSLPVTLFAIDYLEKRKWSWWLLIEKIPHFGLSLLFGYLSIVAQKDIGALASLDATFNPLERFALGCYALCNYLWKAVVPTGLSNFYPYPLKVNDALPGNYYIYPVIVLALAFAVWRFFRKNRPVLFGIGFFIINIILLLQFIPVGGAIMSDRYGYIPYIGLFFILGWYVSGYFEVKEKVQTGKMILAVVVGYCLVLGYLTNERCKDWYDSVSLWKDDIEKHPEAPVGYFYLGQEYFTRYEKAADPNEKKALGDSSLANFNLSVARKPDYVNPIICIAELQRNYGQIDAAKKTYFDALRIDAKNKKEDESVYLGLGVVYSIKQQFDSAEYCFRKAITIKPFLPEGYSNFANFYDIVGKTDSSLAMYAIAISQNPDAYIPYMNRGRIYYRLKKYGDAIKDLTKAIQLNGQSGDSYYVRAKCYAQEGNKAQAQQDTEKAKSLGVQIDPNFLQQLK